MSSIISKEQIAQAKEKLGDRNAEIIAEVLKLEKYNPQRRIGCCPNPNHQDDTPSFSYNPKSHSFYCFGCHTTMDVIDAWISTGMTFMQAADKLLTEADIKHDFRYRGVPSDRDYIYPEPHWADNKDEVYAYWQKRCISPATIDALGIMQDQQGNTCFPYYDQNDVLRCVKVRPSRSIRKGVDKSKCWWMKSDTMHLLFNQHRCSIDKPLMICCGEGDCAAAYECGFQNTVSIPMGDGNMQWASTQFEWLEQFNEIILVHDNDDAGRKWIKEAVRRLGEYRCKVVDLPETYTDDGGSEWHIKDLNEYLYYAGPQRVMDVINQAQAQEIESVVDRTAVTAFNIDDVDGIRTGFDELDAGLGKIYCGTTNLITGITGSGKSSFISTIVAQSIDQHFPVWIFSAELNNQQLTNWVNTVTAGQPNLIREVRNGHNIYRISPNALDQMNDYYRGQMYIYKDTAEPTGENILRSLESSVKRYGVRTAVIDNLMCVTLPSTERDRWIKQDEFVRDCVKLAQKLDIILFLVLHPKKMDMVRPVDLFDLAGVTSSANLAHRIFSLYRIQPGDREPGKNGKTKQHINCDVSLRVLKDRFGSASSNVYDLFYDIPSRRFFDSPAMLARQYAWDKEDHRDALPYFDRERYEQIVRSGNEPF